MGTKFKEVLILRIVQVDLMKSSRHGLQSCGKIEAHGEKASKTERDNPVKKLIETQTEAKTLDLPPNTLRPVAEPPSSKNRKDGGGEGWKEECIRTIWEQGLETSKPEWPRNQEGREEKLPRTPWGD